MFVWVWRAWPFPLLHTHQPRPTQKKKKKKRQTQLFGALVEMPGPLLAKKFCHESMNAFVWSRLSGTPSHISHPIMRSGAAVLEYIGPAWEPEAEIFTQSFLPLVASDIVNHTQMSFWSLLSYLNGSLASSSLVAPPDNSRNGQATPKSLSRRSVMQRKWETVTNEQTTQLKISVWCSGKTNTAPWFSKFAAELYELFISFTSKAAGYFC